MSKDKKKRRRFSGTEKTEAVKRHCLGGESVSSICEDLKIHVTMFYEWQRQLFENGSKAFEREARQESNSMKEKLEYLESKLIKKDSVLSELMEEHIALKKSLGEL
jgi:transposase